MPSAQRNLPGPPHLKWVPVTIHYYTPSWPASPLDACFLDYCLLPPLECKPPGAETHLTCSLLDASDQNRAWHIVGMQKYLPNEEMGGFGVGGGVWVAVKRLVPSTGLLLARPAWVWERRKRRERRKILLGLEAAALDGNGPNPSGPCLGGEVARFSK